MACNSVSVKVLVLLLVVLFFERQGYCEGNKAYNGPLEKGMYLLKSNQDQAALEKFNEVLSSSPYPTDQHEEALYFKGQALLSMRREEDALQVFKLYLEQYPKGKYITEASLIYKGFKSEMEYRESVYGKFFDSRYGTVFTIVYIFIWLYAIVDVAKGKLPTAQKAFWIIFALQIPIVGIIIYFWVKRYRKRRIRE